MACHRRSLADRPHGAGRGHRPSGPDSAPPLRLELCLCLCPALCLCPGPGLGLGLGPGPGLGLGLGLGLDLGFGRGPSPGLAAGPTPGRPEVAPSAADSAAAHRAAAGAGAGEALEAAAHPSEEAGTWAGRDHRLVEGQREAVHTVVERPAPPAAVRSLDEEGNRGQGAAVVGDMTWRVGSTLEDCQREAFVTRLVVEDPSMAWEDLASSVHHSNPEQGAL